MASNLAVKNIEFTSLWSTNFLLQLKVTNQLFNWTLISIQKGISFINKSVSARKSHKLHFYCKKSWVDTCKKFPPCNTHELQYKSIPHCATHIFVIRYRKNCFFCYYRLTGDTTKKKEEEILEENVSLFLNWMGKNMMTTNKKEEEKFLVIHILLHIKFYEHWLSSKAWKLWIKII